MGGKERGVEGIGGGPEAGPVVGEGAREVGEGHAAEESFGGGAIEGGEAKDDGAVEGVPESAVFA